MSVKSRIVLEAIQKYPPEASRGLTLLRLSGSGYPDSDGQRHRRHKYIHNNKVADASGHDKQMKDFMGAEVFMTGIKNRKLQRVDNAAYGIDDAASQEPSEGCRGKGVQKLGESQYAQPAHGNV